MLRIRSVEPLDGHGARLTLTDGSSVIVPIVSVA